MSINGSAALLSEDLEGQFETISRLMYDISGVTLSDRKRDLVKARLSKRMRAQGWTSLREYVRFVQSTEGKEELARMVDSLTTNKTSFFREPAHFDFLRDHILPASRYSGRPLSIWSAGCSSGEEPYTLAMVLAEAIPEASGRGDRILATDLSSNVLEVARSATYPEARLQDIPAATRKKWFTRKSHHAGEQPVFQVVPALRDMVTVARLNLMGHWPMHGPFDLIFCRNVMIYFDRETRSRLVERFADILAPGGYLFVGHSESLTAVTRALSYVQPAVYRK